MAAGWSQEETQALIGVWGETDVQRQLDGVAKNRTIYESISVQLRNLSYEKSWLQCRTKNNNMTNKYRKVSDFIFICIVKF